MKYARCFSSRDRRGVRLALSVSGFFVCTALCATPMQAKVPRESPKSKTEWSLQDIVTVPEIVGLSISGDGRRAMYITRHGNPQTNSKISSLHIVNLASGTDRDLKSSSWFDKLQVIPGSRDWSVLADLGEGVQLYRVDDDGHFTAMLINRELDRIGGAMDGQESFGVSDYGWAPDGKTFWYEKRTATESLDDRAVDPRILPLRNWYGSAPVELRVRTGGGQDVLLETSDAVAGGYFEVEWNDTSSSMSFWIRDSDTRELKQRQWQRGDKEAKDAAVEPEFYVPISKARGLHGGTIKTTGLGNARKLVEVGKDGSVIEYGSVGFQLGDPRASGSWISPDREVAFTGTRYIDVPRYGLARIKRSGEVVELTGANASLTHCSISEDFTAGVCVRQSMVSPPTLVRFDPRKGGVKEVESLAPHHAAIEPLKVVPRIWTNRDGYKASGFVVYPRNYRKGQKYPAILVTHGSDADEMFVNQALQWEYPVQVWAEQGYLVIAMNDPTVSGSKDLQTAYAQWGGSKPGPLSIDRLQDLVWINGAWSFEDAVKELAAEGLVDANRVGIAGYSRGSQMVNVTMTQSKMFHAASSGDGGYLEPHGYFVATRSYRQVFGGSPFDPAAAPNYQRLSPTFRAAKAAGPILQQVALGSASQLALHVALREAGIPSELVYYPNESHLFHQPKHRLAAMQENLDWFDFWLLGKEDPDPGKAQRYKRWRAMRDSQRDSNGGHGVQGTRASGGSG